MARLEVGIVAQGGLLLEVGRTGQVQGVVAAGDALVAVKHGKAQVLHVHAHAVAHDDHQQGGAHKGQGQADGVASQLQ